MAETIEKSLLDLDFAALTRRTFAPAPAAWEDQVTGGRPGEKRGRSAAPAHNFSPEK
jgi:hypothetical protein